MNRLSNMTRNRLENYVDAGEYCDQDVIDLYDDLMQREEEIENLKNEIIMHRSNYDSDYWEEQEKEWKEDFPDEEW